MYVLKTNIEGKTYWFTLVNSKKVYILGSAEDCNFYLPIKGISRKHCKFIYKRGKWWIKDLNSTNGTYLNGTKIDEEIIKENDVILCGISSIKVLKKPTGDWVTTNGEPLDHSMQDIDAKNEKKITDSFLVPKLNLKMEHLFDILFSNDNIEKKYERFMELMEIENLEVIYKYGNENILIFSRLKNTNKDLSLINKFSPEFEIMLYPTFSVEKNIIISASCILLAAQKMGYKLPCIEEEVKPAKTESPLGVSKIAKKIWDRALVYKDSYVPILITGETGVGKEYFAQELHKISNRAKKPFIPVNFSEHPVSLMQSEIFGIEEKIATGVKKNIGKFELANGGTILLDEIGDLSMEWQIMLLRIIENNYFYRVGGNEPVYLDVRFMFLTNKNIEEEVEKGNIRKDFYFRIKGVHFEIPPLRERKEDIPFLLQKFLNDLNKINGKNINYSIYAWNALVNYSWPGNVRELKNEIEKIYPEGLRRGIIQKEFLTIEQQKEAKFNFSLKEEVEKLEMELIIKAINSTKNISEAIKLLDIPRTTFYEKIKKYKIKI